MSVSNDMKLYLNVRVKEKEKERILIDHINSDSLVKELESIVSEKSGLPVNTFHLLYCGRIIEEGETLTGAGIMKGSTVYVVPHPKTTENQEETRTISEDAILRLASSMKTATKSAHFRQAVHRAFDGENKDRFLREVLGMAMKAAVAGNGNWRTEITLATAVALDPELLAELANVNVATAVAKAHPAIFFAARGVLHLLLEQTAMSAAALLHTTQQPSTSSSPSTPAPSSSGYSYTLDALADAEGEDDEAEPEDEHEEGRSAEGNVGGGRITSDHLAEALASALSSRNLLPLAPAPTQMNTESEPSYHQILLRQMNEIGLTDDVANLRALQISNWNLDEAVNLVLSGVMED